LTAKSLQEWAIDIGVEEEQLQEMLNRNGQNSGPQFVTLDKIAAIVGRKKKTLERELNKPNSAMPQPDVESSGGKPHEWEWSRIRPWLESKYGRRLPQQYPTMARES
jgi:hypothetical protein